MFWSTVAEKVDRFVPPQQRNNHTLKTTYHKIQIIFHTDLSNTMIKLSGGKRKIKGKNQIIKVMCDEVHNSKAHHNDYCGEILLFSNLFEIILLIFCSIKVAFEDIRFSLKGSRFAMWAQSWFRWSIYIKWFAIGSKGGIGEWWCVRR